MVAGVFGLKKVYKKQQSNEWPEDPNFGYFAGGNPSPSSQSTSRIERLDFSNETVSNPPVSLNDRRHSLASVSNNNYGYFGGGRYYAPDASFIDKSTLYRVDFSSETTTNPTSSLSEPKRGASAISNSNYGYFAGGIEGPTTTKCTIDRLDFSSETIATPGLYQLTARRYDLSSVSNNSYGYFAGGAWSGTYYCVIDRLDFSNETISNTQVNLDASRWGAGESYNPSYGYFAGGYLPGTPEVTNTIERLDFANETTNNISANLSKLRYRLSGVSNNNYGYFAGGWDPSIPGRGCTIDRLDFSNETISAPGTYQLRETKGQLVGASSGTSGASIRHQRKTSSTDVDGNLISSAYGYFAGGAGPNPPPSLNVSTWSIIDRLDFSNDSIATPGNYNLWQARRFMASVSNNNYGYFAGGLSNPGLKVCTIDRLEFTTETVSNRPANQLRESRWGLAGVSNNSYGYFAGGDGVGYENTIDRIDFISETVSLPGNNLTFGRRELGSVHTPQYGYFAGGEPITCSIDRIDFSNETTTSPSDLTARIEGVAGVFNSNYGYFGGGMPPYRLLIDRFDFSNETSSAPGTFQLSEGRKNLTGVSNNNYGYFAGGYGPNPPPSSNFDQFSTIERLEFSNETVSTPTSKLSKPSTAPVGVSN